LSIKSITNKDHRQIMNLLKQIGFGNYRSAVLIAMLGLSAILAASSTLASDSKTESEITFNVPKELTDSKIKERSDVIRLMNSDALRESLKSIAGQIVANTKPTELSNNDQLNLSSIMANHNKTLDFISSSIKPLSLFHYSIYAQANLALKSVVHETALERSASQDKASSIEQLAGQIAADSLAKMSDETFYQASYTLDWSLEMGQDYLMYLFKRYQTHEKLSLADAVNLINNYQLYHVYDKVLKTSKVAVPIEQEKRFIIEPNGLVETKEGIQLSTVVVRKRGQKNKQPAAFQFTIYANQDWHIKEAIHAAAHGYVGVIANTRGKRNSPDKIIPWEHEGKDANAVIDWISKQSWSDGRVAMYGGSYNGFTQWAAAKYMHPALKTMVPYAAANPLTGLPIENNIFITPNYQWAFHVTNNKTMDQDVYSDWQHWQNAKVELFESGRAFRDIDKVEGTPNPWFQKWLDHPDFDEYYQAMLPFKNDYKKINIPVLSITGYFDGGQISAVDFLKRHYKYNLNANHTLLIGPYNHRTAQQVPSSHHSNYQLDPVALQKDTAEITFEWFNHVLFGLPKPKLIKDKVNYQLMGSNTWQHHASFEKLNQESVTFYLGRQSDNGRYLLQSNKPEELRSHQQIVDLADRKTLRNVSPWPVIQDELVDKNGLIFITKPFESDHQLAGAITGRFSLSINKRDVDIGYNFFEIAADGKVTFLNHYQSRASYAKDMGKRELLIPNKKTMIPIINARMTAKLVKKGSRLAIVLNVNKNPDAQVNMGTGKDVSDETAADGKEPLVIKWFNDSEINIPIKLWK
jgi:uncharacterized protein